MEMDEVFKRVREKYYKVDSESGSLFLLAVFFEEAGELAEAVRRNKINEIEEELADVLFMVISLSNLFNVNPGKRLVEKYLEGDPSKGWDLPMRRSQE